MSPSRLFVRPVVAALAAVSLLSAGGAQADTTLLNVSYDVARELYKEINPAFVAHWQRTTGEKLTVNQSHGGSSKQIQSVIAGLEADVVTMNQAADLDVLAKSGLTGADWRKAFPNAAAPYTSAPRPCAGAKPTAASSWPTPGARWACTPGWPAPTPAGAS